MGLIRQRVQRHLEAFALLRLQETVWGVSRVQLFPQRLSRYSGLPVPEEGRKDALSLVRESVTAK